MVRFLIYSLPCPAVLPAKQLFPLTIPRHQDVCYSIVSPRRFGVTHLVPKSLLTRSASPVLFPLTQLFQGSLPFFVKLAEASPTVHRASRLDATLTAAELSKIRPPQLSPSRDRFLLQVFPGFPTAPASWHRSKTKAQPLGRSSPWTEEEPATVSFHPQLKLLQATHHRWGQSHKPHWPAPQ